MCGVVEAKAVVFGCSSLLQIATKFQTFNRTELVGATSLVACAGLGCSLPACGWHHSNPERPASGLATHAALCVHSCTLLVLLAVCTVCQMADAAGVDVGPVEVAPGLLVVPLLSWYNTAFDVQDPRCVVPLALPLAVFIGQLPALSLKT